MNHPTKTLLENKSFFGLKIVSLDNIKIFFIMNKFTLNNGIEISTIGLGT